MKNYQNETMEWAPFTVKEGVQIEQLVEASNNLQEDFLRNQEGFVRRDLVQKSEREFVDIILWKTADYAHNAIANAEKSPACFAYFQLMEEVDQAEPGAGISHFNLISEFAPNNG